MKDVFVETVEQLNENPAKYQATNPLNNESLDILLKGDGLTALTFGLLYSTNAIPSLPKIIYDAHDGDFDTLALLHGRLLIAQDFVSLGMQLSVQCNEELPFTSFDEITAANEAHPFIRDFIINSPTLGPRIIEICEEWVTSDVDPIEDEPVISDIPTLVLAGE